MNDPTKRGAEEDFSFESGSYVTNRSNIYLYIFAYKQDTF